jgi:FemAB-related protein (PEP-CTERM system-associated)
MTITICKSEGEAVSGDWDAFVAADPNGTLSHLYEWSEIIANTYGHKTFYLTACQDGEIAGILPLVHIKSRLFGNSLVSMPFQDYGGIVAKNQEAFQSLLDRAFQLKKEHAARFVELRYREEPAAFALSEGTAYGDKSTLILDISQGAENLWKSFSPKVRNQVRKAQKSGLTVQIGGSELLDEFYRPFAVNMRDLGSPVHPPKFFTEIFRVFGDDVRLALISEGKETVGGLIVFFYKNTAIVPWASCYRGYFSKCPNNLLYWETMQYACARGCTQFDFGRSSQNSGTYHFKLQWGAVPFPLHWRIYGGGSTGNNAASPAAESRALRMASAMWKHIPVGIANVVGPRIRRYLSN